ncbi:MAG: hypothetical protein ACKON9_16995, partial [Planctomycetaceae bacterium]
MAFLRLAVFRPLRDSSFLIDPQTELLTEIHFHAQPIRICQRRVVNQHLADIPLKRAAPAQRLSQKDTDIGTVLNIRHRFATGDRLSLNGSCQLPIDVESRGVFLGKALSWCGAFQGD